MQLRRETGTGIGAMLLLQVLLSMLAITLLTRMGPAIEHILEDNVYSAEAVEEMLAAFAHRPAAGDGVPEAFEVALDRARSNVTEEAERPLLAAIEAQKGAAFAGEVRAGDALVDALRALADVNHESMIRADARAKRLGTTGAWAAAILGALAFALAIAVYRRLRARLDAPIEVIATTARRVRGGNAQARCPAIVGPHEVVELADDLNWILDRWQSERNASDRRGDDGDAERHDELRRLVGWLLDRQEGPVVVVDERTRRRVAASRSALDLDPDERWTETPIPESSLLLIARDRSEESADVSPTDGR